MLLFTILVAKSRGVRLIMSSSPHMYLFRILRYSVLCWVIVIELLLCFCCVFRAVFRGGGGQGGNRPPDVFNLLQIQRQIYKITGHLNLDQTSRVTYVHV